MGTALDFEGEIAYLKEMDKLSETKAKTMRHAVYAGTFDPFTKGHLHVLRQAIPLFDKITIAIGVNATKAPAMFNLGERLRFLRDVSSEYEGVDIGSFDISGPNAIYTANYAESIGAQYIIRGLRNSADFENELSMSQINLKINPRIHTVFFMADRAYADISSSTVRGLIGPGNWQSVIRDYIPESMVENFVTLVDLIRTANRGSLQSK